MEHSVVKLFKSSLKMVLVKNSAFILNNCFKIHIFFKSTRTVIIFPKKNETVRSYSVLIRHGNDPYVEQYSIKTKTKLNL